MARKSDIVIIGAGIAGLACAKTLVAQGLKNVTVFEARSRIGGRLHSFKSGNSSLELGAQFLEGRVNNPVFHFAAENGLVEDEQLQVENSHESNSGRFSDHVGNQSQAANWYFTQDGNRIPDDTVDSLISLFEDVMEQFTPKTKNRWLKEYATPALSMESVLDKQLEEFPFVSKNDPSVADGMVRFLKSLEAIEASESLDKVHLRHFLDDDRLEGCQWIKLKSDFECLLNVFAQNLPADMIQTNAEVVKISLSDSDMEIVLRNGEKWTATYCILTVPLGVFKDQTISFEPALPCWKTKAINSIGYGVVDKIFVEFERQWWPSHCKGLQMIWSEASNFRLESQNPKHYKCAQDMLWYRHLVGFDTVEGAPTLLEAWLYGYWADVVASLPDEEVVNVCFELLQRFTRNFLPVERPIRTFRSAWGKDPFARGSYSFKQLATSEDDHRLLAAPLPNEANPRLLFAGEATHATEFACLHGAYKTGVREAFRLINLLKPE